MSRVRVLPAEIVNRIAAGEVVERPASVLKELVDNALDAGSTRIVVRVEKAGTRLIEVSDDGYGMSEHDALLCLENHATSKVPDLATLEHIGTYGFRGEALPSIASVSRFSIISRVVDSLDAVQIDCEGGQVKNVGRCGAPKGTCMRVRDLFFNVPARRKFLKSPRTEDWHLQEMFISLALARPDVAMQLISDGRTQYNVPATQDLKVRASAIFGRSQVKDMLSAEYTEDKISINGLVSRPGVTQSSSREMRFFVNRRPVEARELSAGVRKAYEALITRGRFPLSLLFIELEPQRIDINVHPAKKEIRFREGHLVTKIISHAVMLALRTVTSLESADLMRAEQLLDYQPQDESTPVPQVFDLQLTQSADALVANQAEVESVMPSVASGQAEVEPDAAGLAQVIEAASAMVVEPVRFTPPKDFDLSMRIDSSIPVASSESRTILAEPPVEKVILPVEAVELPRSVDVSPEVPKSSPLQDAIKQSSASQITPASAPVPVAKAAGRGLGDLNLLHVTSSGYLLAQGDSGILFVSLQAARERILFEEMLAANSGDDQFIEPLLFPATIELSRPESLLLEKNVELLQQLGLNLKFFGGTTWMLSEVPHHFPAKFAAEIIRQVLETLRQDASRAGEEMHLFMARRLAARTVRYMSRQINEQAAKALLKELDACETPFACPAGKPVILNISDNELKRRFGR